MTYWSSPARIWNTSERSTTETGLCPGTAEQTTPLDNPPSATIYNSSIRMLLILLLMGAALPLAIAPGLLFHYDVSPKTLTLCVAASLASLRVRAIPPEMTALWQKRGGRMLLLLAALQIFWIAVASAMSTRPRFSLFGSAWRQFGVFTIVPLLVLIVLAAAHFCAHPERIEAFLRIAAGAGVIASVFGIAQYFDLDPFQPAAIYRAQAGDSVIVRPPGTLGHADYFAWWLAIEFFCGVTIATLDDSRWRAAGIACAALAGAATLLSGTRAAYLAILAGAVVLLSLATQEHPRVRMGRKHAWAGIALLAVLAAFCFSPAGVRLRARAVWSGDEPAGGARPRLWRDSVRMSVARPVFGFGPETFPAAFGLWESEELARQFPAFHHESPHNVALDALTSEGVPGLLLVCAWVWLGWKVAVAGLRVRPRLAAGLAAAMVASLTAAMFDAATLAPVLLTLLVLAILVALEPSEEQRTLSVRPWVFAIAGGIVALSCSGFGVVLAVSDFRLARFQKAPGAQNYEAIRKLQLPGAADDVFCSRTLLNQCQSVRGPMAQLECWRFAEQAAARATVTADDTANAWYNLAAFTAAQNDVRGTRMALGRAMEIAPVWFKPHWTLAKVLSRTGDLSQARREAQRAAWLNANHDPEVADTLAQLQLQ
jgi:O-antigen ligase